MEDDDPMLSIGVFARHARLSPKALRVYDRQGLLAPDRVDAVTGYRYYRQSRLATARLIVRLRGLDMPLARIAEVLAAPEPEAAGLVAAYWEGVERRIAAQRELAVHLRIQLSGGTEGLDMYEIRQRDVPEQVVLVEQRHVRPEDLSVWIPETCSRLEEEAKAYGGVVAAPFVVYHGEVNEDSDGPVELCVPIDPLRASEAAEAGTPVRTEPAHREAYTTLTKAQVEYPQILSAYDAVYRWIETNDGGETGPGREVYFADWAPAGPATEVCDIAVPVV
ncbi:MerR family transcriptional regulator [Streptomyces aureoversilis]|uniref:MerR family transcriptional regulator n=1 Tax=Streptomyces aureoversilis TaxID=67277 RepID=A0ABW0A7C1_9ACTN